MTLSEGHVCRAWLKLESPFVCEDSGFHSGLIFRATDETTVQCDYTQAKHAGVVPREGRQDRLAPMYGPGSTLPAGVAVLLGFEPGTPSSPGHNDRSQICNFPSHGLPGRPMFVFQAFSVMMQRWGSRPMSRDGVSGAELQEPVRATERPSDFGP